jgi:hypothetical protein
LIKDILMYEKEMHHIIEIKDTIEGLRLQAANDETYPISLRAARNSLTIRNMLEDLNIKETQDVTIPIPKVPDGDSLRLLCSYMETLTPTISRKETYPLSINISTPDLDFIRRYPGRLFELYDVAQYLDIQALVDLVDAYVASLVVECIQSDRPEEERLTAIGKIIEEYRGNQ